jgi:hypothetical protein
MIDVLADECVDVQLVYALRRLGYEVRTVREYCQSKYGDGFSDEAVLLLARERRLAVLTTNVSHFVTLHPMCPWHHGILLIDVEADVRAQARRIDASLKEQGEVRGKLVRLTPAKVAVGKPRRRKRRRKRRGG